MAKNKTTMSKSSDLLKLSLKLQVQMICNLVHIMCVASSSIQILRFVMIGQRTPLITLASDWLKVSANASPL
jgi:hypothetical protein